jgi:uncharacterized DUF497 family protein
MDTMYEIPVGPSKKSKKPGKTRHRFRSGVGVMGGEPNRVEILAPYPLENRRVLIGRIGKKLWTAIYTLRADEVRIISFRRARKKETRLYEEQNIG